MWKNAQRPVVVVGADVARRVDADFIFGALQDLAKGHAKLITDTWNGVSVLHRAASRVAALDLGFVPGVNASTQAPSVVYLLGADEIHPKEIPQGAFVIYQVLTQLLLQL
jgi:NADH dehydrogenase (ubiquinone) Fe-S protein 1